MGLRLKEIAQAIVCGKNFPEEMIVETKEYFLDSWDVWIVQTKDTEGYTRTSAKPTWIRSILSFWLVEYKWIIGLVIAYKAIIS